MNTLVYIFLFAISSFFCPLFADSYKTVLRWDWSALEDAGKTSWGVLKQQFPHTLSWGVGDSAFQTEGTQTDTGHCQKYNIL